MMLPNNRIVTLLLCIVPHLLLAHDIAHEFYTLASKCKEENKTDQALAYYDQALTINPQHVQSALDAGNMLYGAEKFNEAIAYYEKVLAINSTIPEIHFNIGMCYLRLKNLKDAFKSFEAVIGINSQYVRAYLQIGIALCDKKEFDAATTVYKKGLAANPDSADLYHHLARAVRSAEKYEEAIILMRKALELSPKNPNIMLDLANTLHMLDEFEQSFEWYKKALEIKPDSIEAIYNLGFTLKKCGDMSKARKFFEQAIEIHSHALSLRPNYPAARFSRALSYLTLGNFELGWPEYEARWAAYNESPKKFASPLWEGQDLKGKRILIYAEQGYGDTFQFIRYGKVLKDMGAHVIAQTQHRLEHIIALCPYLDEVVSDRQPLPPFDYHIALMSIPMVVKTTVETVPHEIPYLHAKPELIETWKEKLSSDTNFKVGICWQGNKSYRSIFLKKEVASKAMQLNTFEPLSTLAGASLYSLQKINGTEQLDGLTDGMNVITFDHFDEEAGPFMDTAAIMRNLNLIITVDTSIGHLAAGLGAEVWVLLPFPADWRWMLERDDTPWYKNMRLFRQKKRGDWDAVIQEVKTELQKRINSSTNPLQDNSGLPESKKKDTPLDNHQRPHNVHDYIMEKKNEALQKSSVNSNDFDMYFHQPHRPSNSHIPEEYRPYISQSEELQYLTHQLLIINKKLWQLEKDLHDLQSISIFDDTSMKLIQEINKAHTVKTMIAQQMSELTEAMKKKS